MARVGVCEDDPAIRRILVDGLRLHEHEPVVTHNGTEAVRLFAGDERLDVLVLDIGLPDSDGRDVCVALRSAGQMAPALFLTALDQMHEKLARLRRTRARPGPAFRGVRRRPGASTGDWLSQQGNQGLNLGTTTTSYLFLGTIVALVIYLQIRKPDVTPVELVNADDMKAELASGL